MLSKAYVGVVSWLRFVEPFRYIKRESMSFFIVDLPLLMMR